MPGTETLRSCFSVIIFLKGVRSFWSFPSLHIMTVPARGIFAIFNASILFVFNEKK